MSKKGLILGTSKLFSMRDEMYLVCCGECEGLFHLGMEDKRETVQCPNCRNKIDIVRKDNEI